MPHPEVVEMRRRLARIMALAEEAAKVVGEGVVERLLDAWADEKITTGELVRNLERLARRGRGRAQPACSQGKPSPRL